MLNTFEGLNIDKAAKCLFKELMTILLYTFIKRHLCTIHFKVTLQNRCSTMLKKSMITLKAFVCMCCTCL
jgi:hypothetical protein